LRGGSGPVECGARLLDHRTALGRVEKPTGGGKAWSWSVTICRSAGKTSSTPSVSRKEPSVGWQVENRLGIRPISGMRVARTALSRRRTQRIAPGKSTSGPRMVWAAASTLPRSSTSSTTCSMSRSVSGNLAARQSASRLKVCFPFGQCQRGTRVPDGLRA